MFYINNIVIFHIHDINNKFYYAYMKLLRYFLICYDSRSFYSIKTVSLGTETIIFESSFYWVVFPVSGNCLKIAMQLWNGFAFQ